ncbi:MAG: hypothetical protein CVU63_16225, partial [Deltaproteobacteria bacterium HGW-Deltaproteobacteria-20]
RVGDDMVPLCTGTVTKAADVEDGYGLGTCIACDGSDVEICTNHMDSVHVTVGCHVTAGTDVIGTCGNSGNVTPIPPGDGSHVDIYATRTTTGANVDLVDPSTYPVTTSWGPASCAPPCDAAGPGMRFCASDGSAVFETTPCNDTYQLEDCGLVGCDDATASCNPDPCEGAVNGWWCAAELDPRNPASERRYCFGGRTTKVEGCDNGCEARPEEDSVCATASCLENPAICDDGDPCTDDTCDAYPGEPFTCVHVPNDGPGCQNECPAPIYGTYSACAGFQDVCDEFGTRSRNVTTYEPGTCTPQQSVETETCTRSTEGVSCGTPTVGSWSQCSYSDSCDETATRSRAVSMSTCHVGICTTGTTQTETETCSRDTDGNTCSEGTCIGGVCVPASACEYTVSPQYPTSSTYAPYSCPGGVVMGISGHIDPNTGVLTVRAHKSSIGPGVYRVIVFGPDDPISDQARPWNVVKAKVTLTTSTSGTLTFPAFDSLLVCGGELNPKAYAVVKEAEGNIAHFCSGRLVAELE